VFGPEGIVGRCCRWNLLEGKYRSQILVVHAALLPGGRNNEGTTLYFGGNQNITNNPYVDNTRLFDCKSYEIIQVLGLPNEPNKSDIFCSGHAFLADGRLLVGGGSGIHTGNLDPGDYHYHGAGKWVGIRDCWLFDYTLNRWIRTGDMNRQRMNEPLSDSGGRWYPTFITLGDGRVLALGGHPAKDDRGRHNNTTLELYSSSSTTWEDIGDYPPLEASEDRLYPRLHALPGGDIFCATPILNTNDGNERYQRWNPSNNTWSTVTIGIPEAIYDKFSATSVLLPLLPEEEYRPRVLLCGGHNPYVIDLWENQPSWQMTGERSLPRQPRRYNLNSVILPTGEIFICGGVEDEKDDSTSINAAVEAIVNKAKEGETNKQ
jgi:hypothetical protein